MFKAFSILAQLTKYWTLCAIALQRNAIDIIFIFCLLVYKLYINYKNRKDKYFRNYAILAEVYIIYLFVSAYGNLLFTGIGFIMGGILLLVSIYVLKKVLSYMKKLGVNN